MASQSVSYAPIDREASGQPPAGRFPVMSDGRQFTDYRPRCVADSPNGISSHDYKDILIRDAEKKIEADRQKAGVAVDSVWCYDSAPVPPTELVTDCTDRTCSTVRTGASEPLGITTDNTRLGA